MRDWRLKFKTRLNLKNPQTLNEKIQWMMLNTDLTLWAKCADKYKVRSYIKECGYEKELPKLYGVWKNVDEINYENLPEKFVIKCNHDCGSTHVIDKSGGFDKKTLNADLKRHLKTRFGAEFSQVAFLVFFRPAAEYARIFSVGEHGRVHFIVVATHRYDRYGQTTYQDE